MGKYDSRYGPAVDWTIPFGFPVEPLVYSTNSESLLCM